LFAFWRIGQLANGYIMTFEGKKIDIEEFKLYLLMSTQSVTPKEDALEGLKEFLILEKAAKDREIVLTDDEKAEVREYIDYIINSYGVPLDRLKLSEARLIEIIALDNIYYKLWDVISEELNFTVDEGAYASELEFYRASSHDYVDATMKYVLTETSETAGAAREALVSGMPADDVIAAYSEAYDPEAGDIDVISLSQIGVLDDAQAAHLLSLGAADISDVMEIDGEPPFYLVFIIQEITIPTAEEVAQIESDFRDNYIDYQKYQLFMNEVDVWKAEANIEINDRALENFDIDKFFDEFYVE